jgi:hypothetical protein
MDIFLDSPQDFENLCLISRTLEVLGIGRCYVHDPNRLVRPRYGKSRTRQIKAISAGAFFRVAFERVDQPEAFLAALPWPQGGHGARPASDAVAALRVPPGRRRRVRV